MYKKSGNSFKKPGTGAIFPTKEKRSDKTPDYSGTIDLDDTILNSLLSEYKKSGAVRLRVSAWKNVSQDYGTWLKLWVSKDEPRPPAMGQAARPSYRSESKNDENPWD